MSKTLLKRRLWYTDHTGRIAVEQSFLKTSRQPLIVLGEAGMGKSTLLSGLSGVEGFAVCNARQLINVPDPKTLLGDASTLVIDALDEVSAHSEGDAVDMVLRRLLELDKPRFILSCRVADWRSATALQSITDFYDSPPIELHLEALTKDDAINFLTTTLTKPKAEETIDHLDERGLSGLWHNPQTLAMIEKVAAQGKLPDSKGNLFLAATKLLQAEHRREKSTSSLATLPEEDVLDTAGAAFAALILSGKEAVFREVNPECFDIALAEISALPNAAQIDAVLDSRLFEAIGDERFTYTHRAIGEFLGARWLSKQANTKRKRRRLLALFNNKALVPNSLRGIHAWLAWHSQNLATDIITADPMGILEYGDANRLTPGQGRTLLDALYKLSCENPRFRDWWEYRADGLVQPALIPKVSQMIGDPDVEFGLRLLLLQLLKHANLDSEFIAQLQDLLLDESAVFALRDEAGDRLIEFGDAINWPNVVGQLIATEDENSARLALEFMDEVEYEQCDDALILKVVIANLDRTENTAGVFYRLGRNLPINHIDALLDSITAAEISKQDSSEFGEKKDTIVDLIFALLGRRLTGTPPDAAKLWQWLRTVDPHRGFQKETRQSVARALQANDALRHDLQRHVFLELENGKDARQRLWAMPPMGLQPNVDDIVWLLDSLDSSDPRWRELVQLSSHSQKEGRRVRKAANRFSEKNVEDQNWLKQLAQPQIPQWQIEQEHRQQKQEAEKLAKWKGHRAEFGERIESLRAGEFAGLISPAKAYLKLFSDMGDKNSSGPDRIEEWLGTELRDAALTGFEVFLTSKTTHPTATEIATDYADGKYWDISKLLVVALAERVRNEQGFSDLPNERLIAGFIELSHSPIHEHADLNKLDTIIGKELRARDCWEDALRLLLEPQLKNKLQYVKGLYSLMRGTEDADLAEKFGSDWIERFPNMAAEAEMEILDNLLTTATGRAAISSQINERLGRQLSDEQRLTWDAVGLILDFKNTCSRLEKSGTLEAELFWTFWARTNNRNQKASKVPSDINLISWVIRSFRNVFPYTSTPEGGWAGDTNPWDATSHIVSLINQLGNETYPEAGEQLLALREAPEDGYTDSLRIALSEQKRKQVEATWAAPDLRTIISAISDQAPTTSVQLQAVLLEELAEVQEKVRGSNIDWYKDFFEDDNPRVEDVCRNTILKMFGELPFDILAAPEGRMADGKRCDIECTLQEIMVPIEIKGQWHQKLWTAADRQLDLLYTNDYRAECGIYLVLWFGPDTSKNLHKPPKGVNPPTTADALKEALTAQSASAQDGRTEIFVLDLTRPA